MTLADLLSERLEAKAAEIADAYDEAVDQRDMRSIEAWITRVYGKPVERVVTETTDDIHALTPEARKQLRLKALARLTLVETTPDEQDSSSTG